MKIINVSDFTTPGDRDSAEGIRRAIEAARTHGADVLRFEAGRYRLSSTAEINVKNRLPTDTGTADEPVKSAFICAEGLKNLRLEGAKDADGGPATSLAADYGGELNEVFPAILWLQECENIVLGNFKLFRAPYFGSAGEVTASDGETLTVRVFDGCPIADRMGSFCMNRFTKNASGEWVLTGESLTYGPGGKGDLVRSGERELTLCDPKVASRVKPGDAVSWHNGAKTDYQTYLGDIRGLTLTNIHTVNTNGFAMIAYHCKDIEADGVTFAPEGNMLFTGPRDAWKLHSCSGNIRIRGMRVEGVRMDGQNMHSTYFFADRIGRERRSVTVKTKHLFSPLENGTEFEFYNGTDCVTRTLSKWIYLGEKEGMRLYALSFEGGLPDFTEVGTHMLPRCFEPDSYLCENSSFKNIAGAGHLSRIDNMLIRGCRYENLMNPGILMGAEFKTFHEGGNCTDCVIEGCEFVNCGFHPRYGAVGCVGIRSSGLDGPYNKRIRITGCAFRDSGVGVDICDAEDVEVADCTFENIGEKIRNTVK